MHIEHLGGRHYAQFEKMGRLPGLVHGFSTRAVDVGMREDARAAERAADRRAMAVDLGLASERLCCCVQVHEGRIAIIESGEGPARREGFDGLITNVPGLGLMTFSADCPLVWCTMRFGALWAWRMPVGAARWAGLRSGWLR